MLVYRVYSKTEVDYILNNSTYDNVVFFSFYYAGNSHKYEEGYCYMHFFAIFEDAISFNAEKGSCLCERKNGILVSPTMLTFHLKSMPSEV